MSLAKGTRLGVYKVIASLGSGGMGEVYRARDTRLGREVAIKILPEELGKDRERRARFEREAKLLASLNHSNIATLYGFENRYIIMELVEGETLAERIARGAIPVEDALPLFVQIAEGLEAAHDKGIIHRDLKPANVKIDPAGNIKILDFGLAKAFALEESVSAETSESLTITKGTAIGAILGTAAYMSPEQARGKSVDSRSDVFAFGAVLFEAITGRRAFEAETVTDTLAAVVGAEPDSEALPPDTPREIRALLSRCLRKDVRKRAQHIGDVRIALEEVGADGSVVDILAAPSGKVWKSLWLAAGTALVAAALTWVVTRPGPTAELVTRSTLELETGSVLFRDDAASVAISPDGRTVAYVAQRNATTRLYLRSLDGLDATAVSGTEGAEMPFFSDDRKWVGFGGARGLRKVPLSGGAPSLILDGPQTNVRGASWGEDGKIVLTLTNTSGVSVVDPDNGGIEELTTLDPARKEKTHRLAETLPGGEAVLFASATGDIDYWDEGTIAVVVRDTGLVKVLVEGGSNPRYSHSGHLLYARDGAILAVTFDVESLSVTGTPVTVVDNVETSPIYGQAEFAVSREGTLVYARGGAWGVQRRVVALSTDGAVEPLIEEEHSYTEGWISPDGRSLAVTIEGANSSIWIHDRTRGTMTRFASGFDNWTPVWAPDGRRLAFFRHRDGLGQIYLQAMDGSRDAELLARGFGGSYPQFAFSGDGNRLAYVLQTEIGLDMRLLSLEPDGEDTLLLEEDGDEREPRFSPDMRWLAYSSDESGRREVYLRSFLDLRRKWQVSADGGESPRWSHDGRRLYFRQGNQILVVDVHPNGDAPLSIPALYLEHVFPHLTMFDVMKDGRIIAIEDVSTHGPPGELVLVQNFFAELERLAPASSQ